jgi:hypothetical protein
MSRAIDIGVALIELNGYINALIEAKVPADTIKYRDAVQASCQKLVLLIGPEGEGVDQILPALERADKKLGIVVAAMQKELEAKNNGG